ncbi:anaphase-promoting complex subunit 1 protein [Rutstroemia sp. NJR-2017a BBW]|nr:anaphase-promoting complex subunit 1 protein [Rutstroemia sp. NJR-2017a BBW]
MAAVTSIGLHQPTGIQYAIQEGFLAKEPATDAYDWYNVCDEDDAGSEVDDELLVTPRCVIWSRGGIFRKSYNFDLEKEPITQALLTSFPSVGALPAKGQNVGQSKATSTSTSKSKAIVVFLKTQAHVYFLSGTSHVIHLPFEVEFATAAPEVKGRQSCCNFSEISASPAKLFRFFPASAMSTFSIAELGAPKQMPLPHIPTMKDMWEPPSLKNDANWPRLFSLSDPLSEMGLVVAQPTITEGRGRRSSGKITSLDTAEEILHVSRPSEFPTKDAEHPLVLAITLNRETSMYTVWRLTYIGQETASSAKARATSGATSRRRSSFMPGSATGATTPVGNSQQTFRESFSGAPPTFKKPPRPDDIAKEKSVDFASTLDPDFEGSTIPRRKSRRVSSMLARADLSASHERNAFTDLATGHQHAANRVRESLGSQHTRASIGPLNAHGFSQASQLNQSLNSFLDAPVDELLDELRAGGDFEGFHNMGLDDDEFDALKQEVVLTKVCSVPAEHSNVRYSTQNTPAKNQCRIFILPAPASVADDQQSNSIVICILDSDERKLLVMTLNTKAHRKAHFGGNHGTPKLENEFITVSLKGVMRAEGVIDACKFDDGDISRILVLTETDDGFGELSLQAPWSVLIKVPLPSSFAVHNVRNLSHDPKPREKRDGGFKRVLSQGPRALKGLRNPQPRGLVDLIDDEGKMHQLQILMQPRNPYVRKIIQICSKVIPGSSEPEGILVSWWMAMRWVRLEAIDTVDVEWTSFVIVLFSMVLGFGSSARQTQKRSHGKKKSRTAFLRSSSGAQVDSESWDSMLSHIASNGNPIPPWANNGGWKWLLEQDEADIFLPSDSDILSMTDGDKKSFVKRHVGFARDFLNCKLGQDVASGFLPSSSNKSIDMRQAALIDTLAALHLLHEEEKLDTMASDSFNTGAPSLTPVLAQIVRWLGWESWIEYYETEEATIVDAQYDNGLVLNAPMGEPFVCPSVYSWIQNCFLMRSLTPFMTLQEVVANRSIVSSRNARDLERWRSLTPRTLQFAKFFALMQDNWSSAQLVEALATAGVDNLFLETLPETILAPLQEAIIECQREPPTSWDQNLLALVGREDVSVLLSPGQLTRTSHPSILAPSHESNLDIHAVCASTADVETTGAFDGSAEVDRQAISRAIFKDDRRMNEAMNILNTFRPTVARVKSEPDWTESELLEAQKEHAQMLAYRTLAIPSGRGLLYYSARIPLLTQRFAIGGFNLSCVMRPNNNTIGVDKNAFTEEKVCWAFFHAGVSAGLSISRDAKGIDTSWILYNKPVQDLSNRHAGFLLALGLNGHLKSVAKWVAFRYLTPKHTMTSIGLLLGLAASYMGTMDSLITRLLSVHVTRMLPPGAAELNLSPLTQTTGIMGIGLLYCNTQHRRMSEIMLSEIEHIDQEIDEEPLRNEGYRLAAGFALGYINLGKGSDLKGLHDMRLTERLVSLAAGSKKVDLVHILDKATAAAVVAIALIYMKSENQVLARKVDVPDSILQFDYVRPDIFLLRTLARHLIMWSQIEPSFRWIRKSLPAAYKKRGRMHSIKNLTSADLPFYDIITGLCFSIALRFAGSASTVARDILLHYLDQFMRICRIEADTFDKKLARNTVRNCQDLLALAAATVMAGTGDIAVLRRLRSMHGRDDSDTPYGSHLAAHLAIGALFLGGGTFTFSTSDKAIAALLVAFYPIFPSSVQDNKSHLQAFRHFWVLAAEPRCLVTRDIDTDQPVPIPLSITLRSGEELQRHTPCLIPELGQISTVRTCSPEYWNFVLDFEHNSSHVAAFIASQTIHIRKRPAHDASTNAFKATLQALDEVGNATSQPLQWLFDLPAFATLTKAERALVLGPDCGGARDIHAGTAQTSVDSRLVLEHATLDSGSKDRLLGLRLMFEWADKAMSEEKEMRWIRKEVVQRLQARVWVTERE